MFTGLENDDEIILFEEDLERLGHIGSLDELRAGFDTHMKILALTDFGSHQDCPVRMSTPSRATDSG